MAKKTPIEDQYQLYLKRIGLTESMMHKAQKIQLRQTFFGAWGQFLLMIQEGDEMTDDQFETTIDSMMDELKSYWLSQKIKLN